MDGYFRSRNWLYARHRRKDGVLRLEIGIGLLRCGLNGARFYAADVAVRKSQRSALARGPVATARGQRALSVSSGIGETWNSADML